MKKSKFVRIDSCSMLCYNNVFWISMKTCWAIYRSFPIVWHPNGSKPSTELKTGWSGNELRHQSRIVLPVAIALFPERIVKVTLDVAIWNVNKFNPLQKSKRNLIPLHTHVSLSSITALHLKLKFKVQRQNKVQWMHQ
jgi:hypothetical protein